MSTFKIGNDKREREMITTEERFSGPLRSPLAITSGLMLHDGCRVYKRYSNSNTTIYNNYCCSRVICIAFTSVCFIYSKDGEVERIEIRRITEHFRFASFLLAGRKGAIVRASSDMYEEKVCSVLYVALSFPSV